MAYFNRVKFLARLVRHYICLDSTQPKAAASLFKNCKAQWPPITLPLQLEGDEMQEPWHSCRCR